MAPTTAKTMITIAAVVPPDKPLDDDVPDDVELLFGCNHTLILVAPDVVDVAHNAEQLELENNILFLFVANAK
jgi:hypothetical protein